MDCISESFRYINGFPEAAVYAIICDTKKEVYVGQSTKFKGRLGDVAFIQNEMSGRVEVFSSVEDHVYKLILAEKVRLRYVAAGYAIINQIAPFIRFRADLRLDTDHGFFLVYLTTSRGAREVVGAFRCINRAEGFMNEYYDDKWDGEVICAVNAETRRYYCGSVYKRVGMWKSSQPKTESKGSEADMTQVDAGEDLLY